MIGSNVTAMLSCVLQMGEIWLVMELHQGGSATNKAV